MNSGTVIAENATAMRKSRPRYTHMFVDRPIATERKPVATSATRMTRRCRLILGPNDIMTRPASSEPAAQNISFAVRRHTSGPNDRAIISGVRNDGAAATVIASA